MLHQYSYTFRLDIIDMILCLGLDNHQWSDCHCQECRAAAVAADVAVLVAGEAVTCDCGQLPAP